MKGIKLVNIISTDSIAWSKFGGLYSVDELVNIRLSKGYYYICNTDRIFSKGKHWVVIYWDNRNNNDSIEFFDSLGKIPSLHFYKFMKQVKNKIIYSNRRLQSVKSDACGYFCLYFIFCRMKGISFNTIINNFSNNLLNNETYVKTYIKHSLYKRI